ncbi:hypothetical protein [Tellurirhabdus rosea]|uniref:hypothetical protein n=1 Tax=Tellurirhabdus rosea TaxID=2674997 RepID=UPI00225665A7|nr:hypothetical protein [Tellurirhabdus rosea]
MTAYQPIDRAFYDHIQATAQQKKFVRFEFLTDLHEYYKRDALIKSVETREDGEYLILAAGDEIRLDRVISVGGVMSPHFPGYESTYACSL